METISVEIDSNEDLWNVIDKKYNDILVHRFMPHEAVDWWQTSLKIKDELFDLHVRNMEFDIRTDLEGLRKLLDLNTLYMSIYQFEKPVPGSLVLQHLPEQNAEAILKQNGLKHIFFCDHEHLTVSSFDESFIKDIAKKYTSG
jgi:hypothetical protein